MKNEDVVTEYKKSLSQEREGVISLSAMLNKSHRGEVFFGIGPDKKPHPLTIGPKTLPDLSNEIRTSLKPMPTTLDINVVEVDGSKVIRVYAEGEDTPYSAYGRYFCRLDDGDIPMTNNQLQKYFEAKDDTYSGWEEKPADCGYEDIDEDLVLDVIRTANEKGRLNYVYKGLKEAMTKLDLVDKDGRIKTAGYYLFGKGKPVMVKEASYPTDSRTEFGEIKQFKGNIFECIRETVSYIQNHISYKSEIQGIQRVETPEIPIEAIREIVVNSFVHSKYGVKGDFNQITIFKSSIRIYNPGSIYKNIDPMKFATAEVGSKIRNVLIASVLYKCGYIDAFGTGFERTFTLCDRNSIGYEYRNDEFGFTFLFIRNKRFLNDGIDNAKDDVDEAILDALRKNKFSRIDDLAKATGKAEITVYRHLKSLRDGKILKRIGSRKSGYWEIL